MMTPVARAGEGDEHLPALRELVVTATKRTRTREEVAGSVTLLNHNWLATQRPLRLSDLAANTPGLSILNGGGRNSTGLVMRGMRVASVEVNDLEGDGGSVARFIDDVPLQGDYLPPDLPLIDLARVEVLRGPQSTLYGSGAMAGVIRYVTAKPDPSLRSGSLAVDVSDTAHSNTLGRSSRLVANLPLARGKAATRLALGVDREAGFIDNDRRLTGPARDINGASGEQGRLSLRWQPDTRLTADASVHYHHRKVEDRQATNSTFTGDPYKAASRYPQPADMTLRLANLTLAYQWQPAQLTVLHSHYDYHTRRQADQTDFLLTLDQGSDPPFYAAYENFSALTVSDFNVRKTASEIRLSSPAVERDWQWLVGAAYTRDHIDGTVTDEVPGFAAFWGLDSEAPDYRARQTERLTERALYGESSYRLGGGWQVTVGGRYYQQSDALGLCSSFPLIERLSGMEPAFACDQDSAEHKGVVWKLNGRQQLASGAHWYGAFSEGIRRGGSNALPVGISHYRSYDPDAVDHYELGFRSGSLWPKHSLEAALYYVDWRDVQVTTWIPEGYPVLANAGRARVLGAELTGRLAIGENWGLRWGATYSDARLRNTVVNLSAVGTTAHRGDRLPGSPRRQWHLALDSRHRFDAVEVDTLVSVRSVGEVTTALNRAFVRYRRLPAYTTVNAQLGLSVDRWHWTLSVDNLLDERALTGVRHPVDYGPQGRFEAITRPRTVTVGARLRFQGP